MDPLQEFADRLSARLATARKDPHVTAAAEQYMIQFEPRYRQFEEAASRLVSDVIRPRLEVLTRLFNAKLQCAEHEYRCVAWLGYCLRFPATVKLELSVEADERIEKVILRYEVRILPAFVKYESHDKVVFTLEHVDADQAAAWVEERLLSFLDTYLRLDRGGQEVDELMATDPVCGMKVDAATALNWEYRGHAYYFCSEACRQRCSESPERYVLFEME